MTVLNRERFSVAIRDYRGKHDLTQKELAERLMTTVTTVARWELRMAVPRADIMLQHLRKLGIKW